MGSRSVTGMEGGAQVWYTTLSTDAGYVREWNFRSDTGFTALGVRRCSRHVCVPRPYAHGPRAWQAAGPHAHCL